MVAQEDVCEIQSRTFQWLMVLIVGCVLLYFVAVSKTRYERSVGKQISPVEAGAGNGQYWPTPTDDEIKTPPGQYWPPPPSQRPKVVSGG